MHRRPPQPEVDGGHGGEPFTGPSRRARIDEGATLVEVIVAIALLAIVVVPVLVGLATVTKASAVSRASSNVETALINAVDRVNRADAATLQLCEYGVFARAAVVTQGWSAAEVSTVTEYLDTTTDTWVLDGAPGASGCPSGTYVRGLVQRVTITVTDPNRHVRRSIQVVKSNV